MSSGGAHYFWDPVSREKILLPPLDQFKDRCVLAATIRQMEYLIRSDLLDSGIGISRTLEENGIFSHSEWHEAVERYIVEKKALEEAENRKALKEGRKPMYNPQGTYKHGLNHEKLSVYAKKRGIHCTNGSIQKIDGHFYILMKNNELRGEEKFNLIKEWLDMKVPVVAVFNLEDSYTDYGDIPYVLPPGDENYNPYCDKSMSLPKHAVVIVGYYIADAENSPRKVRPGKYLIYQESHGDILGQSSLGNGLNLVDPCFIIEALTPRCDIQKMLITAKDFVEALSSRKEKVDKVQKQREDEKKRNSLVL